MALRISPSGKITPKVGHRFTQKTLFDVVMKMVTLSEAGKADWVFSYKGSFGNIDLIMELSISMPIWTNYRKRTKTERTEWDRFYKALIYHEDMHISICKREVVTMHNKLQNAKSKAELAGLFEEEKERIQKLNEEMDRKNDHGKKQKSPYGTTIINIPTAR